jgi:hypothetical protein
MYYYLVLLEETGRTGKKIKMSKNKNGSKTRTEKRFLASLVGMSALVVLVMITSSSVAKAQTTSMTKFTDYLGRFSISYPSNWTSEPATNRFQTNAASFSNGNGSGFLVQVINSPLSPEIFARGMSASFGYQYSTFQDVECSKYKVDGNRACSFISTKSGNPDLGTRDITVLLVVTSINNKIYTINFASGQDTFDSILPTFETMLNSFKALGTSGSGSTTNSSSTSNLSH